MFPGFPKGTSTFLKGLDKNNNKEWFDAHRADYDNYYMEPARHFVNALGAALVKIEPGIRYEAKVNKSIFRINRDIRFSKDKTPYKNHLDLWFWLGDKKGWDAGGFFIRITPTKLILGAGIHAFEKELLKKYRKSVVDKTDGKRLSDLVEKLKKQSYEIGGAKRKTVPKGFDVNHPRAPLLLHEGLVVVHEEKHPPEISSLKFVDYCAKHFQKMAPLNVWLQQMQQE
jgi:uncharacterized protein (TIGR02453 family)